ncbi:MAG: CHAT domain-containing protein [Saprospiraceae bacterium]
MTLLIFFLSLLVSIPDAISQSNDKLALQAIYNRIEILMEKESLDSTLYYYHQALAIASEAKDTNYILSEIGYIHAVLENYEESIVFFKKALNHALIHTPKNNSFIEDQYYYIAYCQSELEDYDEALHYNKKSLSFASKESNPIGFAQILSNIASIYSKKSDYDNAILYELQALDIFKRNKAIALIAESNNGLSLYYFYKQNYSKALTFSYSAISSFENIIADSVAENCISAYNNHVLILSKTKDFENAKKSIDRALTIHQKWKVNHQIEFTQFNQAFLFYKSKNWKKALLGFSKSIDTYSKKYPKGHTNIGKAYYYIGKINEEQNLTAKAIQAFQTSLQNLVPNFKSEDILQNPNLDNYCRSHRNLLRTLVAKAGILNAQYLDDIKNVQLESAIFQTYDSAIKIADELRQSYQAEGSRYFLAEETKELFENATNLMYQLYDRTKNQKYLEKAFFYVEKNQAPILFQNHLAVEGQSIGGVPIKILQKEKQLKIDFDFYKNQLAKNKNDERKSQLYSNYMFNSKLELDSLRESLKQKFPQYFDYQYGQKRLTIQNLQNELSVDQLFLQYYQTSNQIFVFAISKTTSDLFSVKDVHLIKELTTQLLLCIQNPLNQTYSKQEAFEKMTNSAHQLYTHLIELPLSKLSKNPTRLAIASNGFLTEIPFEILLSESIDLKKIDYLSLPYLVKSFAISYQPSASLMVRLQNKKRHITKKELLAFAPFSNEEKETKQISIRSNLENLPFTKKEIDGLKSFFSTTTLHQNEALKSTFLREASDYQILHLATHGIADFREGYNAKLFFYPNEKSDSTGHILHSYEVQNLQLNANLAVLSACETGAGKIDIGEGILSLARSFFYTGTPSVIMSKWQINDQSSSLIINELYNNLNKNSTKDIALQNAKKSYLQSQADMVTAHPFYWASLVQLGNSNALKSGIKNWWIWSGLCFFSSIVLIFFFLKRKKY